jgi:bromodomain-containing protein 7/9
MCTNAMIYNKPETIYYKAAKKLLHSGMKILSQVKKLSQTNEYYQTVFAKVNVFLVGKPY